MEFKIIRRFYSNIQANIYFLKLQEAGIQCFLSSEHISTILPLSDGGIFLNVAKYQIQEAVEMIKVIDIEQEENEKNADFSEATKEDIYFEKGVQEYKSWLDSGWIDNNFVSVFMFLLFIIVVLGIVVNFFFPYFPT